MIRLFLKSVFGGGAVYVLGVAALIALLSFSYGKGRLDQAADCRTEELTRELEKVKADNQRLKQQAETADAVRKQIADQILQDVQAMTDAKLKAKEFEDDVQARDGLCPPIGDDDASRLRNIT